jgi:hypothetical protein
MVVKRIPRWTPFSVSPARSAASRWAWLSFLHPGDLAVELFAKSNGCLEEALSSHSRIQIQWITGCSTLESLLDMPIYIHGEALARWCG